MFDIYGQKILGLFDSNIMQNLVTRRIFRYCIIFCGPQSRQLSYCFRITLREGRTPPLYESLLFAHCQAINNSSTGHSSSRGTSALRVITLQAGPAVAFKTRTSTGARLLPGLLHKPLNTYPSSCLQTRTSPPFISKPIRKPRVGAVPPSPANSRKRPTHSSKRLK